MDKNIATFLFVRYYHKLQDTERFKELLPVFIPGEAIYYFQYKENALEALRYIADMLHLKGEAKESFIIGYFISSANVLYPPDTKLIFVSPPSNY